MSSNSHRRRGAASLYGLKSVFDDDFVTKRTPSNNQTLVSAVPPLKRRRVSSPIDARSDTSLPPSDSSKDNLPDPLRHNGTPTDFLCDLFHAMHGIRLQVKKTSELDDVAFFQPVTEEQIAAYTMEIVNVVRENDVDKLRSLHQADATKVHCTNQFGESLLHRACRRGHHETTEFLLKEANVSVRIADDTGRNPLHDACWNPNPQLNICGWLMERDPTLFLVADKRGFPPFEYARSHHWSAWKSFLYENRSYLDKLLEDPESLSLFTKENQTTGKNDADRSSTQNFL